MFGGSVKVTGMDALGRRNRRRLVKAQQLGWLDRAFRRYIMKDRLPSMWRNQGVIKGPYGKGSRRWAPNTEWTARAKGFNKPLFSTRTRSKIKKSYEFVATYGAKRARRTARMGFKLTNTRAYVKYLEAGYPEFTVRPKRAGGVLAVPIGPRTVALLKETHPGPMLPRWITGFVDGDAKWLARYAAKHALKVGI